MAPIFCRPDFLPEHYALPVPAEAEVESELELNQPPAVAA